MTATYRPTEADEDLARLRTHLLSAIDEGLTSLGRALDHLDALRAVDGEFASGRDGRDIHTRLDDAIRDGRAAYAVTHMIIEKERP